MKLRASLAALATATTLAGGLLAAPAGAATHPTLSAIAPAGARPHVSSTYLSGYQTTQIGISRASVTFILPSLDCPSADPQGIGFGIGHEDTVGSPTLAAIGFGACLGVDSPVYDVQAIGGGASDVNAASPGDLLTITVTQTPTLETATVNDRTAGVVTKASGAPAPDNTMVFGSLPIFYGSTDPLPVPNFGSVTLRNPYLENTLLSAWSPTKINRATAGVTQIGTTNFLTGGGFAEQFRSN